MKRTLSTIALAVLTVGLLGSCAKINERLDGLDKRLDGLENEQIASINSQVESIKSSIADLGQIRSDISGLKQSAEIHSDEIFALQEADETLGNRIRTLENYVDTTLPKLAGKDWVETTYSTLEQYDSTCIAIAEINVKIGDLDTKIAKDIEACADSLTRWINTKFKGYYTAAQMDAELAKLKAAIDTASGVSEKTTDSLKTELKKAKVAIDTAKAQITRQYTSAIATAITTSEGRLTKALNEEIDKVNERIDVLAVRVTNLERAVDALWDRVDDLENMIQSVTIVPAYSDGSVKVEDDTLFIDLAITPKGAVATLGKDGVKILLNRVQTKAVFLDTVPTGSIEVFETYEETGTVSIKANIAGLIPGNDTSLTVAVNVKVTHSNNLTSDYTTEFVPVNVIPAGALPSVFSVSPTKKVRFSKGNLYYDGNTFEFEDNQYAVQSSWNANHISNFCWSKDARVAYSDDYEAANSTYGITPDASDVFFTNTTETTARIDFTVNNVVGKYRILSITEWKYLFNKEGAFGETIRSGKYNLGVTVCGTENCVVLLPDNWAWKQNGVGNSWQENESGVIEYSEETSVKWSTMEAAGAVCLPAAGRYDGSVIESYAGTYWSSSVCYSDIMLGLFSVYSVYFGNGIFDVGDESDQPKVGCSVRLVTDVK